jgi:hypothetical protein
MPERYKAAVKKVGPTDQFCARLARQGVEFGLAIWVLCEARLKGRLGGSDG